MNKTNIKKSTKLALAGVMASALGVIAFSLARSNNAITEANAVTHDENCYFNHYSAVERGYSTHGSKEFWACCSHPGSYLLDAPSTGHIEDKGEFTGAYFNELDSNDDRYISALNEGDVLYDASAAWMVPHNYYHTTTVNLKTDSKYGNYCELADTTNTTTDAFWARPYESTGDSRDKSLDISKYTEVVFYVKSSIAATVDIKNAAYSNITSFAVEADVWTPVVIAKNDNMLHLIDLAPAIWGTHDTPFTFSVTSMYGFGLSPFEGMETVFDAGSNLYVPLNWNTSELDADYASNGTDKKYGNYCQLNIKKSTISDAVWVKPSQSTSLSAYSKILFYVYSNQDMDSFQVRKEEEYTVIVDSHAVSAGWNKVEIDLTDATTAAKCNELTDIGIAYWSHVTNLVWKITSIYGVKSA